MGSGNWIVDNLNSALAVWNEKLAEIWQLITMGPESFRGGSIWAVIMNIHGAMQAIGYALLVLFFTVGVMKTAGSFAELKRPEHAFKLFIRFVLAKALIDFGLEFLMAIFNIVQGTIGSAMSASGLSAASATALPAEIITKINEVGFWDSIPLWLVTLLGSLVVWVLSLVMILTVYSRFFKLYMTLAISPLPLASFAGEPTSSVGKAFLKSFTAICLEGLVIVLSCVIFSVFAASPPAIADPTLSATTIVWNYLGELIFTMLVLVGSIKMSDRIIREMMGL